MLHFASNWPEGSLALCENETSSFAVLKQQFWIHRTWTKMLIFTEVFSLIGNQVKTLWPLVPLSRAEFCQEVVCDVETLSDHQL